MTRIAIVGMACHYPDASSPQELWANIVAGRRAFRRIPEQRMRLADYWDADPATPDRFHARNAAVIEGYEFDRVGHRIAGSTYRATDLTHWLALDVAGRALADAGFLDATGLDRTRTGVIVGNTLTGEFTRANLMRLRWPYVRRTLVGALSEQGWDDGAITDFLADLQTRYKSAFPPVDEDSLAGGLSNTIAGRICNYFDLHGGGYAVDGACSSSLLSVIQASRALLDGELDTAIAGGVDLSIDPFEIIGFAKTGALATGEMRVYDRGSNGFWPGEGCGMVVLMREPDALAAGHRIYASIAGWGISSDGKGGITRPEVSGYRLALDRAYQRAGFGIDTVALFEGHGTGTPVGDTVELSALSQARTVSGAATPAAIGTIKAMIGHTKAAAGVAGLIKAVLALHEQVLPPIVGCFDPHPILTDPSTGLRALRTAEPWPVGHPLRAGVTSMGFGGINTHIVLENSAAPVRHSGPRTIAYSRSPQDAELILVDADSGPELRTKLSALADWIDTVSYAQLADVAGTVRQHLGERSHRAAIVVNSPEQASARIARLVQELLREDTVFSPASGSFAGPVARPARIGFLFPGQGSGNGTSGGALRRRFPEVDEIFEQAALTGEPDRAATLTAQPRIVTGSRAGLAALARLGLQAGVAVGHSLGEITALHWAGLLDGDSLTRVATKRGASMTEHALPGAMAALDIGPDVALGLIRDLPVVIAGYNGPRQTVLAGSASALDSVARRAPAEVTYTQLPVSHAFHSPLMTAAAADAEQWLQLETFTSVQGRVVSTVTGEALPDSVDVRALLRDQITNPVLFAQALQRAAKEVDLLVEVGPGQVLTQLAQQISDVPTLSLDTDDDSIASLLKVAGAAFVSGAELDHGALFEHRLVRPLEIGTEFAFFASPCEQVPASDLAIGAQNSPGPGPATVGASAAVPAGESTIELLRRLAAERAELPPAMVNDDSRLLDDLHFSSITVGQLVNRAAKELGMAPAAAPLSFATATLRDLAETLDTLAQTAPEIPVAPLLEGVTTWARAFRIELTEAAPATVPLGSPVPNGFWRVHAEAGLAEVAALREALEAGRVGDGVLVCLPPDGREESLELILAGARAGLAAPNGTRFLLVQSGRGAAAVARTLRLESPQLKVTIVHTPAIAGQVDRIVAEVAATTGFNEVHLDPGGGRRVPVLHPLPVAATTSRPALGSNDVLLVTGGGKGITAECALMMAEESGARLAVLGRSDPAEDGELSTNLRRMRERGVNVRYLRADVTDPAQVRTAVRAIVPDWGPVTGVLHGAGYNAPAPLSAVDRDTCRAAIAPKIDGLNAVLAAIDPTKLALLVTFGSIIGRAGLQGEAHYAVANEWLADLTERLAEQLPHCRCLCLEWSVWSGVGMGEKLSVIDSLTRDGITAVSPDQGLALLRRLLNDPHAPTVAVVAGRTGAIDTIRRYQPDLPLLRFLQNPLLHYPGVELITEVELNRGTDPYLGDHLLDGNLLLPAVIGMEAMAQAAVALTGRSDLRAIEQAEFLRPVVVAPEGSATIRIAAQVVADDVVEVVIRSSETGFAAEHFRAGLRFGPEAVPEGPPDPVPDTMTVENLDPAQDLYGSELFQGGRFQRLRRYHRAAAHQVDVVVEALTTDWFASYLPDRLVLGDPGLRDALMHGNQVCVPGATLLPTRIERIHLSTSPFADPGEFRFQAEERRHEGDTYVYDIAVRDSGGAIVERWEGLHLHAVHRGGPKRGWATPLLRCYLERGVEDLLGVRIAVAVEPDQPQTPVPDRRATTARALSRAAGHPVTLRHRPDGRPEVDGDVQVSAAHGAGLTVAVLSEVIVACDLEMVTARSPEMFARLLGPHAALAELTAAETGQSRELAMTRVWAAMECLQKACLPAGTALGLEAHRSRNWTIYRSGGLRIATVVATVRNIADPVVFAILSGKGRI